jgi:hypothetical protein
MSANAHVQQKPSGSAMDAPGQRVQATTPVKRAVQKRTGPPQATNASSGNPDPPPSQDVPTQDNDLDVST